jgi:hypothetical protein
MNRPFVVRPEARLDALTAREWYEEREAGLGSEFAAQVADLFDRIAFNPELYGKVWRTVRIGKTRRFPYLVCYRIRRNYVEVLAVIHSSRDDAVWKSRAKR